VTSPWFRGRFGGIERELEGGTAALGLAAPRGREGAVCGMKLEA